MEQLTAQETQTQVEAAIVPATLGSISANKAADEIAPLNYQAQQQKAENEGLGLAVTLRKDMCRAGASYCSGYLGISATVYVAPLEATPPKPINDPGLFLFLLGSQLVVALIFQIRAHLANKEGRKGVALNIWLNIICYLAGGSTGSIHLFR